MKDKMLYIMHVDWFWIKQRPQFFAEGLAHYFDLSVMSPRSYNSDVILRNKIPSFVRFFYKLPFQRFNNYRFFRSLNSCFVLMQLFFKMKAAKFIWITSPEIFSMVKNYLRDSQIVIYDCMDDILEFPLIKSNDQLKNNILESEK